MAVDAKPRMLKHQIVRKNLDALLDDLSPGDSFPSERDLAERYDVSRETLRQAMRELLVAGRIERRGRTTIVAEPKVVLPLAIGSYTEAAREKGMTATRVLVGWSVDGADDDLAELLQIAPGEAVIQLERVFTTDGMRVGLETTRIPARRIPGLIDTFDYRQSLYAELRSRGIQFDRVVDSIETVLP
ncbi:GntR family transcriptional regulator, partial [Caballeronia sordidicola]|uniref:GntR family transcriptional regulator n=1 Tax=Caballeronia sordidicola TaxID=196367 RepID=UPI00190F49E1